MKKRLLAGTMSGLLIAGSVVVSSCSADAFTSQLNTWRSVQRDENNRLIQNLEINHHMNNYGSSNDALLMKMHENKLIEKIFATDFSQEGFDFRFSYSFNYFNEYGPTTHYGNLFYVFKPSKLTGEPPIMPWFEYGGYQSTPYPYKHFYHTNFYIKDNKLLGTFGIISKSDLHPYGDPKTQVTLKDKMIFEW